MENEEIRIRQIIKQVNKAKLIDTVSSIFYYFRINGEYNKMMLPVELEYIMNIIYNTRSYESRKPTLEEILEILYLAKKIILGLSKETSSNQVKSKKDVIYNHANETFLYVKEDTEYEVLVLDYLNLFDPMSGFFVENYEFKIKDFLHFTKCIQVEYSVRMQELKKVLNSKYKEISQEILVENLLELDFCMLNFNEETFVEIKDKNALKNVLKKFATNEDEEKRFEDNPIYKINDTYILTSIVTLMYRAKSIFEMDIHKDKRLSNEYASKKGKYLEIFTENVIRRILKDAEIFYNIEYRENKQDRECDLLVIYDQIILIIEIKGRAFKDISKKGSKKYLQQDLNDNIYKAYEQATRMEEYLKKKKNVTLRCGEKEKVVLNIQNTDKFRIFKIGITLENFRTYAVQYKEFIEDVGNDMIFLGIGDLNFMSKYFRYQTEFIYYIFQRIKVNKYIEKFYLYDELYLFSEYKINNLQSILNNETEIKYYDFNRYKLFDTRFNTNWKENILKGRVNPLFDELIKRIEEEKTPTYSLRILELLDLDYEAQEYIYTQIQLGKQRYLKIKEPVITGICVDEERDMNEQYIVLGMTDKKNQEETLKWVSVVGNEYRKQNYKSDVFGILIDVENEQEKIIEFAKIQKIE